MDTMALSRPASPLLILLAVLALAALPSCAATGEGGGTAGSSRNVLLAEDIEVASAADAYQLIQRHRSAWLRGRGQLGPPLVYLNGQRRGDIGTLRDIAAGDFLEARFLSPSEATSLWGTGHASGVIAVETRRR